MHTVSGFSFTGSGTVTYSWRVDDVEVAVTASYTPTVGQIGGELKRRTTVTNGAGSVFAETDFVVITAFQPYMKFNVNKNSQYVSLLEDV